jgi:hypothetical protein
VQCHSARTPDGSRTPLSNLPQSYTLRYLLLPYAYLLLSYPAFLRLATAPPLGPTASGLALTGAPATLRAAARFPEGFFDL